MVLGPWMIILTRILSMKKICNINLIINKNMQLYTSLIAISLIEIY